MIALKFRKFGEMCSQLISLLADQIIRNNIRQQLLQFHSFLVHILHLHIGDTGLVLMGEFFSDNNLLHSFQQNITDNFKQQIFLLFYSLT